MIKTGCIFLLFVTTTQVLSNSNDVVNYNEFTADIYKELKKNQPGNFAFSPISAQIVLALAYLGAQGQTAQELASVAHLTENKTKVTQSFTKLSTYLQGNHQYILSSVNNIYIREDFKFNGAFKKIAEDNFKADVVKIDFLNKSAVGKINKWVEEKTEEKIKQLVSQNDFDNDTRSVFITALYFEGAWLMQFEPQLTKKLPFHVNNGLQKEVHMMYQEEFFNYYESETLKFLELPFEGEDATMTFVLPHNGFNLSVVEENVQEIFTTPKYRMEKVVVTLPKFQIETSIKFKESLQNLGVIQAFTIFAEFPNIVEDEGLRIENVLQKTWLEVQEVGVTAIASTKLIFFKESASHLEFNANSPFLYYITVKGVVIFIGCFVSP